MRDSVRRTRTKVAGGVAGISTLIVLSVVSCLLPDRSPGSGSAGGGAAGVTDGGAGADTSVGGTGGIATGGTGGKNVLGGSAGIEGGAAQGGSSGTSGSGGTAEAGPGGTGGSTQGGSGGSTEGGSGGQGGTGGTPKGGSGGSAGGTTPQCYGPGEGKKWDCLYNPADGGCCDKDSSCIAGGSGHCCYDLGHGCVHDPECCTSRCGAIDSVKHCCNPKGDWCGAPEDCCSGDCQPDGVGGSGHCGCALTGAKCIENQECCSTSCDAGKCYNGG